MSRLHWQAMNKQEKNLAYIEPVFKALEFLEDNLQNEITLADAAAAVFYSLFHFCRCFNAAAHCTPYDYLIKRRLSRAAAQLLDTDKKIIDIAYDYRFNNPETFSRAFKRMFGIQPKQYRKNKVLDRRLFQHKLTKEHLFHFNRDLTAKPEPVELKELHLTGTAAADPVLVPGLIEHSLNRIFLDGEKGEKKEAALYEVVLYPEGDNPFYLVAESCTGKDNFSMTPLVSKTIPARQFACFLHRGGLETIGLSRDYIYQHWFPRSRISFLPPFELYSLGTYTPDGLRLKDEIKIYIPLKP